MTSHLELMFIALSAVILIAYHVFLARRVRRRPLRTSIGITNLIRIQWAVTIMQERRDVLAVQTMRNWIMASSFLASTAIFISLGILNAAIRPAAFSQISHALNWVSEPNETLWLIKMLLLFVVFSFSFFNFTLAVRYFNHASYGLGIPDQADGIANHDFMAGVINQGSFHYFLGMRGYYLAIPFGLWIFGPAWMLAGTIVLISVLYRLDSRA